MVARGRVVRVWVWAAGSISRRVDSRAPTSRPSSRMMLPRATMMCSGSWSNTMRYRNARSGSIPTPHSALTANQEECRDGVTVDYACLAFLRYPLREHDDQPFTLPGARFERV